jgi:hypothetical protein
MPRQYTPRVPIETRLLTRGVRNGECLLWPGSLDKGGYGLINYEGRTQKVHCVSYRVFVGPNPERLQIQHSCNTPHCYEPSHLSKGTAKQNADYREASGNTARGDRSGARLHPEKWKRGDQHWTRRMPGSITGSKNPRARLTEDLVREIRSRHDDGASRATLMAEYRLAKTTLGHLLRRETWSHV